MKVSAVSLVSFKSHINANNFDSAFLYNAKDKENKNYLHGYKLLTAITALIAVIITLVNIRGKK